MTKIVGILNITPDSFSDGKKYLHEDTIMEQVAMMIKEGVDIIDIGAESTRPNSQPISATVEWDRLAPFLKNITIMAKKNNIQISIDTRNSSTAKKCLEYDIDWINDVSGCSDEGMFEILQNHKVSIVIMHNLGIPLDKNKIINSNNPTKVIYDWFEQKILLFSNNNIDKNRLILDPGLGFGNNAQQAFNIVKNISLLKNLGNKILVGHSRKSMFNICTDHPPEQRDIETFAISALLTYFEVDYLRVHNINDNKRIVKTINTLKES